MKHRVAGKSLVGVLSAWSFAAVVLLTGCGGGGGNTAGGGSTPTPPPSASTGLIPTPAAVGAEIYAEAAVLRPLGSGFKWVYRSYDYTIRSDGTTVVTQTNGSSGSFIEHEASTLDGASDSTVSIDSSGAVINVTELELAPGASKILLTAPELRSPVRINDQWTVHDARIAASGLDVDGDGKTDPVDLAIWRVVVGPEAVSLPNSASALSAVRVDTHLVARVQPSSGAAVQTVTSRLMSWYAPSIGIVRQAIAGTDVTRAFDADQVLLGYDGGPTGWGYLTAPKVQTSTGLDVGTVPGSTVQTAGGILLDSGWGQVLRLDRNGRVVAFKSTSGSSAVRISQWVQTTIGLRAIELTDTSIKLHDLDSDGVLTGAAPKVADWAGHGPSGSFESLMGFVLAPSKDRIWLWWQRSYSVAGNPTNEIVVRAVGLDGSFVTPEAVTVLTSGSTASSVQLSARVAGAVLLIRETNTSSVTNARWISLNASGASSERSSASWPSTRDWLLSDGVNLWLSWNGPTVSSPTADVPHGVRLDASASFVGVADNVPGLTASVASILDDEIQGAWTRTASAVSGSWFLTGQGFGKLFPEDPVNTSWLTYAEYSPGAGAVAGNVSEVMKVRLPYGTATTPPIFVFDDRVLLLTAKDGLLMPTVIWRR
ncbi:MAG: hypothetical protein ABI574_15885 [Burkholderiales bacterium]